MATFKITKKTTVGDLKKQFRDQVGGTLRVFNGGKKADDDDKLVEIGAKTGEMECRTSRTVGKFVEAMENELHVKVKVGTVDDWVLVLDGLTLATIKELPKQTTKKVMEDYLGYQRSAGPTEKIADEEASPKATKTVTIRIEGKGYNHQILHITNEQEVAKLREYCNENNAAAITSEFISPLLNYEIEPTEEFSTFIEEGLKIEVDGKTVDTSDINHWNPLTFDSNTNRYSLNNPQWGPYQTILQRNLNALVERKNAELEKSGETLDEDNAISWDGYLWEIFEGEHKGLWLVYTSSRYIWTTFEIEIPEDEEFDINKLQLGIYDQTERNFIGGEWPQFDAWDIVYDNVFYNGDDDYRDNGGFVWIMDSEPQSRYGDYAYDTIWNDKNSSNSYDYDDGGYDYEEDNYGGDDEDEDVEIEISCEDGVYGIAYTNYGGSGGTYKFPEEYEYEGEMVKITKIDEFNAVFEKVIIPKTIDYIEDFAFRDREYLQEVIFEGKTPKIRNGAFVRTPFLEEHDTWIQDGMLLRYHEGDSLEGVKELSAGFATGLTHFEVPEGVETIGRFAFNDTDTLREVKIPGSVKYIDIFAFCLCVNLTNVNIEEGVEEIRYRAFENCSSLTEVKIPESVKMIGESAFRYCSSLRKVNIPKSVKTIEQFTFQGCKSLCEINIPSSVERIQEDAFRECANLKKVVIPDTVEEIGEGAFKDCAEDLELILPAKFESRRNEILGKK